SGAQGGVTPVSKYDHFDKETLERLLEQRDPERQLGLVWEREEIDPDAALNSDFVALELDEQLSHGSVPWDNLMIERDNYDPLRASRMSHAGRIRCIYIGRHDFIQPRKLGERLQSAGTLEIERLRWYDTRG